MTHIYKTLSFSNLNEIRDVARLALLVGAVLFGFLVLPTAVNAQAAACVAGETVQNSTFAASGWPAGAFGLLSYTVGAGANAVASDTGLPNLAQHGDLPDVVSIADTTAAVNTSFSTQTLTVDDILTEPSETFSLNINAPTDAVLGAAVAQTVQNTISASDSPLPVSLVITKTDGKAVTASGAANNCVVKLTNQGPFAANGVIFTDVVGSSLSCTTANAVTCTVTGVGVVCPASPLTIASLTGSLSLATLPVKSALQFAHTRHVN